MNYVLCDDKILFHGAKSGHKYDSIRRCDKASFCLVADDEIVPEKLTDAYRSVIVFGWVRELTDPAERDAAARLLGLRFYQDPAFVDEEIRKSQASLACFELKIEHMTGKVGLELLRKDES